MLDKPNKDVDYHGRNHNPNDTRVDAHSHRWEANQTNKYVNHQPMAYSNDVRGELCSLFNHHPRVIEAKHFNKDPYLWFAIYTKEIRKIRSKLYKVLCQQYHDGLVQNNRDRHRSSLIIRSIEELINSDDIIMVVYQNRLVGAIRLQQQSWMSNDVMYQRWSLYVLPEFRGDLAWVSIRDLLIKTINLRNNNKPIYSVVKTLNKPTINSSLQSGFKALAIKYLRKTGESSYNELILARDREDFKDMDETESPDDYSVTYNDFAEELFFPDKKCTTPTPDAQSA